ncbi:MAG: hypothetical protein ACO1O1_15320 [Adhaeribacter sp.]
MVPLDPVYQTEFVQVEVDPVKRFIQITWLQQPTSDLFRKETSWVVDFSRQHGYHRALFDVRNRHYLDMSDQNWLVREVFPKFRSFHIRLAYLVSTVGLEIMDTFKIHDHVIQNPALQQHLEIDIFLDREDALNWVLHPQESQV